MATTCNQTLAASFVTKVSLVSICVCIFYFLSWRLRVLLPSFKDNSKSDQTAFQGGLHYVYRGSPTLCDTKTQSLGCPNQGNQRCIHVSIIGLCGHWGTSLRALPVTFSCPNIKSTSIVLQHVDKTSSISESNIVLFSFVANYLDIDVWRDLRKYRPSDQMWVFQTEESPYYAIGLLPPWIFRNDSFDISNTYQSIANIYTPYGYYQPFRNEESNHFKRPSVNLAHKTRFMIWISSHCETLQWDRTAFVKDLQQTINVDIFGKCGSGSLCNETWDVNCRGKVDKFITAYKFYLALENSCCEDYVTEKLWHSLAIGIVPVVAGPRFNNYIKLAPPGSFIHIDQFESALHLKRYLEYLDKNNTAYLEYFQWKTKGTVQEHSIKEHYQNHLSDNIICSIAEQYLERKRKSNEKAATRGQLKMFDPYGPDWKGTCHSCGEHQWIKKYEYPPDHVRNSKKIWTR